MPILRFYEMVEIASDFGQVRELIILSTPTWSDRACAVARTGKALTWPPVQPHTLPAVQTAGCVTIVHAPPVSGFRIDAAEEPVECFMLGEGCLPLPFLQEWAYPPKSSLVSSTCWHIVCCAPLQFEYAFVMCLVFIGEHPGWWMMAPGLPTDAPLELCSLA